MGKHRYTGTLCNELKRSGVKGVGVSPLDYEGWNIPTLTSKCLERTLPLGPCTLNVLLTVGVSVFTTIETRMGRSQVLKPVPLNNTKAI